MSWWNLTRPDVKQQQPGGGGIERLPLSMYCKLSGIAGFSDERSVAERVLDTGSEGRICVCVLPVLEDGQHYYLQCNFRRDPADVGTFKAVNTLDKLCEQRVFPTLDQNHAIEAYLFMTQEGLDAFAARPVHRAIRDKFERVC